MVQTQIHLTKELSKKVKIYAIKNDLSSKENAIIEIVEKALTEE